MSRVRAVRFCFTINNYSEQELQAVKDIKNWTQPKVKCAIAEVEHVNEGEGTPHIQGYLHLEKQTDINTIKNKISNRMHIEVARGSEGDNYKYCSKEGAEHIILEHGSFNTKVTKMIKKDSEAREILNDIENMTQDEFKEVHPYFYLMNKDLYEKHAHEAYIKSYMTIGIDLKTKNVWLWGEAGVGKSKKAREGMTLYHIYSKCYNKWWNGFVPKFHTRVVLDDYPCLPQGDMLAQHMKIWGDRYPFTAEIKGAHVAIEPSYQMIVTSNYPIDQCFSNPEDVKAIKRRFLEIEMKAGQDIILPF